MSSSSLTQRMKAILFEMRTVTTNNGFSNGINSHSDWVLLRFPNRSRVYYTPNLTLSRPSFDKLYYKIQFQKLYYGFMIKLFKIDFMDEECFLEGELITK